MPCPTCDHTIESVGRLLDDPDCAVSHCPRCGTLRVGGYTYAPKLVERCRRYRTGAGLTPEQRALWHAVGLDEATLPPAERPAEDRP